MAHVAILTSMPTARHRGLGVRTPTTGTIIAYDRHGDLVELEVEPRKGPASRPAQPSLALSYRPRNASSEGVT